MKKTFAIFLSLIISFNFITIYAGNGDPLYEHPEYIDLIRKDFDRAKKINSKSYEWRWEKKFEWFKMMSSDYRTVRVYNIPYLFKFREEDCGFLVAYVKSLLQARKSQLRIEELSEKSKEMAAKYFSKEISEYMKSSGTAKTIKDFLGAESEDMAVESFITSLILSASSHFLGAITAASCLAINAFNFLQPILLPLLPASLVCPPLLIAVTVAHNVLNVVRIFTTRSAFEEERVANYALVLSKVNRLLLDDEGVENIRNSNVLVTAVDERNFSSIALWNSFPGRRNDGGWANFTNIENLACSPLAKDYKCGDIVNTYRRIFKEITCGQNLDYDQMEKYIESIGK